VGKIWESMETKLIVVPKFRHTLHFELDYKMPNYIRTKQEGGCYFFTVVTYRRQPFLTNNLARYFLRNAIMRTRQNYPFKIDAWVLLPDHLHCIWTLPENDTNYSTRWNIIKTLFTRQAKSYYHSPEWMTEAKIKYRESTIWQRRFWEHTIQDEADYLHHINYIYNNPVKHGLVEQPQDWLYSTYHSIESK